MNTVQVTGWVATQYRVIVDWSDGTTTVWMKTEDKASALCSLENLIMYPPRHRRDVVKVHFQERQVIETPWTDHNEDAEPVVSASLSELLRRGEVMPTSVL